MAYLIQVTFEWVEKPKPDDEIKVALTDADWLHFAPNAWLLFTHQSTTHWFEKIRPLLGERDSVFISRLDARDSQGWLPKWMWTWIASRVQASSY